MPPPSADHASTEDRDPHPCPEDEEFFECRPDAADMEEAIGKFMEGMEKAGWNFEKAHSILHKVREIVLWGNSDNTSCQAPKVSTLQYIHVHTSMY